MAWSSGAMALRLCRGFAANAAPTFVGAPGASRELVRIAAAPRYARAMSEASAILAAYESAVQRATRIRVVGYREADDPPGEPVWGEVTGPALSAARDLLRVRDDGLEAAWLCECEAVCRFELLEHAKRVTTIEFHGAGHFVLSDVEAIFNLAHGDAIEEWLAKRGIVDPRR